MSLFKLISNTAEGLIQTPIGAAKTLAGAAIGPLDEGETMAQGARETLRGLRKIGNAGDHAE